MEHKKITGYVKTYSREARDRIIGVVERFLQNAGVEDISTGLFSCVDELIKNAVKANYKFLLIYENLFKNFLEQYPDKSSSDIKNEIFGIVKEQASYDFMANGILEEHEISKLVREILSEEAHYLKIKNKAYAENREFTKEEQDRVNSFSRINNIRKKLKEHDIQVVIKVQDDADYLYIEVTNTAPILTADLERIYNKRDEYKKYRDQGKEHEFFINNLDTSESGFGLGYATIDSFLANWGLNTDKSLRIISSIDTTVMLSLPIDEIQY